MSEAFLGADARIELVAALEALTGGNPCAQGHGSRYLTRVLSSLARSHPACALFGAMTPADWRHRHPSLILLDFGPPPDLAVEAHPEHYESQGRGDAVSRLLPALRDFARDEFMPFFEREAPYHRSLRQTVAAEFESMDYLPPLERYVGPLPPHRYHFLISPLYHGGAMHNLLYRRRDGVFDIYSISGHNAVEGGEPRVEFGVRSMTYQAWHEVCHTLVDDVTKGHRAALEPLSPLYGLMTGTAKNRYRGPAGWLHMVDEHVIRAVTSRLAELTFGREFGDERLAFEKAEGFALVGLVRELLLDYERSRDRYPTLADFYPRIVETLRRVGAALPSSRGGGARA